MTGRIGTLTPIFCALMVFSACEEEIEVPKEAADGHGDITVVDTGGPDGRTGWWPTVTFDGKDIPHMAYCDAKVGNLMYAVRDGNSWHTEIVEHSGSVGKYAALAVSPAGRVGIVFYDQGHKYLRYAWRENGAWQSERVAWGLEIGMGSAVVFDEEERANVFYYVPSGRLIHNKRLARGKWQATTIADATGGFSVKISAVRKNERYWVSFVDWGLKDTTLMLARSNSSGAYDVETLFDQQGPGWRSQLIFSADRPEVIYSQSFKERIKIAQQGKDGWKPAILLRDAANFSAVRSEATGDVFVAFEDIYFGAAGKGTVKYLRRSGTKWTKINVDEEGPAGEYLSTATNSRGELLIAYYSDAIRGLKVYDETKNRPALPPEQATQPGGEAPDDGSATPPPDRPTKDTRKTKPPAAAPAPAKGATQEKTPNTAPGTPRPQ